MRSSCSATNYPGSPASKHRIVRKNAAMLVLVACTFLHWASLPDYLAQIIAVRWLVYLAVCSILPSVACLDVEVLYGDRSVACSILGEMIARVFGTDSKRGRV